MTEIVTASRRVAHRGMQIIASALSKALRYLMNGTLNMMKGLILSALLINFASPSSARRCLQQSRRSPRRALSQPCNRTIGSWNDPSENTHNASREFPARHLLLLLHDTDAVMPQAAVKPCSYGRRIARLLTITYPSRSPPLLVTRARTCGPTFAAPLVKFTFPARIPRCWRFSIN